MGFAVVVWDCVMPRDKPEAPENYPYSRENLPDKSYVAVLTMQEGTTYGWPTHEWPSLRQLAALLDIDIKLASSRPCDDQEG